MTELTKTVRRKTRYSYAVYYAGQTRQIVVSLEPGDLISFREVGRRHVWTAPLDRVFRQAVRDATLALQREKRKSKRQT